MKGRPLSTGTKAEIRTEIRASIKPLKQIAEEYNVSVLTVKRLSKGCTHKRVSHGKLGQRLKWKAAMKEVGLFINKNAPVTLRQIYYHLVSLRLIRKHQNDYKYLGNLISEERKTGKWRYDILDPGRTYQGGDKGYDTPSDYIDAQIGQVGFNSYYKQSWRNQPKYIEVWIEKTALVGIISKPCKEKNVVYSAGRGYNSDSHVIEALDRLPTDKDIEILLLTDHDPSGIQMQEALQQKFNDFDKSGPNVTVTSIALSQTQIAKYGKKDLTTDVNKKDPRAKDYPFDVVWELDCLEPDELKEIVKEAIAGRIDEIIWKKDKEEEKKEQEQLDEFEESLSEYFDEVKEELQRRWERSKEGAAA